MLVSAQGCLNEPVCTDVLVSSLNYCEGVPCSSLRFSGTEDTLHFIMPSTATISSDGTYTAVQASAELLIKVVLGPKYLLWLRTNEIRYQLESLFERNHYF